MWSPLGSDDNAIASPAIVPQAEDHLLLENNADELHELRKRERLLQQSVAQLKAQETAMEAQLGPFVIAREVDVGIGLVVLEIDIVRGSILFDQVMLEQQGITLSSGYRDLNIVNSSN